MTLQPTSSMIHPVGALNRYRIGADGDLCGDDRSAGARDQTGARLRLAAGSTSCARVFAPDAASISGAVPVAALAD